MFFHLIRQPPHSLRSLGLTPSPQGEGFEFVFLKNQSRFVGEDIILPKKTMDFHYKNRISANIYCSFVERNYYGKKIKPSVESSLKWGGGKIIALIL